jgi:hypothetical protein
VKKPTGFSAEEQYLSTASAGSKGVGQYVVHKVLPNDTLDRLCLIYNVPKDAIRKAN